MVTLRLERGPDGGLCGFEAEGHTAVAPSGQDVVCAAVSALTQTAALGLERRLGIRVRVKAAPGRFACRLPADVAPELRSRAEDLLETMRLGLLEIARVEPGALKLVEAADPRSERR